MAHSLATPLAPYLLAADLQVRLKERLVHAHVDPLVIAVPAPIVHSLSPKTGSENTLFVTFIGLFLVMTQASVYSSWVATGVVQEKANHTVDIILSSISSRALFAGKILGIGALGLLQFAVLAAEIIAVAAWTGLLGHEGLTLGIVIQGAVWLTGTYLFLAALFTGVAARVDRQEDLGAAVAPLAAVLSLSWLGGIVAVIRPDGAVARMLTYLPPFSAVVATPRWTVGDASLGSVLVAMLAMFAVAIAMVGLGSHLFNQSVLNYGRSSRGWLARRGRDGSD